MWFSLGNPLGLFQDNRLFQLAYMHRQLYLKDLLESLESFLTRKGATSEDTYLISPYAIVDLDGKWHAKGEMGWFGCSTGDMPERDWHDQIQSLIGAFPDDTVMVMVDCHI